MSVATNQSLGVTDLQLRLLKTYRSSSQAKPMLWPASKEAQTSMRSLVRRRHMFQTHNGIW